MREPIRYYSEAIERDSTFALAYSGLADAMVLVSVYDPTADPERELERGREAAGRALALSPERAEIQATAGLVAFHERRFEEALRLLDRAAETAPSYAWAHQFRWQVLASLGRYDESLAAARRLYGMDPLSPIVLQNMSTALRAVDSLSAALSFAERATNRPEAAPYWISNYADLLRDLGRTEEARAAYRRWAGAMGYAHPERAEIMAAAPDEDLESAVEALLDDIVATTPFSKADLVFRYLDAGPDAFMEAAEEAVNRHEFWALWLHLDPVPDVMGEDPRYRALLARVGLPSAQR